MGSDLPLDYRFAWRWLLPVEPDDRISLLGFTDEEAAFWKENFADVAVVESDTQATVCVVNELSPVCLINLDTAKLRRLCVLGSRRTHAEWRRWMDGRFAEISEYALLPPSTPRVVVPLGKSDRVVEGLAMHRPGRFIARAAVFLLKGLARLRIYWPLRARVVSIANRDAGILPHGALLAGVSTGDVGAPRSFVLYLGTPEENRKIVILPLRGMDQVILKQGESPIAQAALRNEADALRAMSRTPLASQVPVLLDVVEKGRGLTLHEEYRPRKSMTNSSLMRAAVGFLSELSRHGRKVRPLGDVLMQSGLMTSKEARAAGQMAYAELRERLDGLAASGQMVLGHRSHGDFAPWNCAWTEKGFFVFDWEKSQPWDVALGDAFYLVLAPAAHMNCLSKQARVGTATLDLAADVVERAGLTIGDIRMYWGLWLLQRISLKSNPLYEILLERLAASWK